MVIYGNLIWSIEPNISPDPTPVLFLGNHSPLLTIDTSFTKEHHSGWFWHSHHLFTSAVCCSEFHTLSPPFLTLSLQNYGFPTCCLKQLYIFPTSEQNQWVNMGQHEDPTDYGDDFADVFPWFSPWFFHRLQQHRADQAGVPLAARFLPLPWDQRDGSSTMKQGFFLCFFVGGNHCEGDILK
jgi:hypothetical protein